MGPGSQKTGYWGRAVTVAKQLAEFAPRETCVHLRSDTKDALQFFERLTFDVSEDGMSYFLEPWVEALDMDGALAPVVDTTMMSKRSHRDAVSNDEAQSQLMKVQGMSIDELAEFLTSMRIDINKFGRGQAKTLEDFHKDLTQRKTSYLKLDGNKLERRVE